MSRYRSPFSSPTLIRLNICLEIHYKASETLSSLQTGLSNSPPAVPVVKAEQAARAFSTRSTINSSGQQASPFLQIYTIPGAATGPNSTPPRFVCLLVCCSCRLFGCLYSGRGANGTNLVAVLRNTIYMAQSALFDRRIFYYSTLRDAFSTPPQRTRTTSVTVSYEVLVAVSWRARLGGIG